MARICVPVCVRRVDEVAAAIERAAQLADVIELRLDCLANFDDAAAVLKRASGARAQMILTVRSPVEGGHNTLDSATRKQFWLSLSADAEESMLDVELELIEQFMRAGTALNYDRVICSYHAFTDQPDLGAIYRRMTATPARILKIAITAEDATGCLPIFDLIDKAQTDGRQIIAIAMGQPGVMTRVLGPARGAFLTFASLDEHSTTAPGQLTAEQLRHLYRVDQIDRDTQILGVVGNPITQSLSPAVHNAALAATNRNAVYLPFEVHDLTQFMQRMVRPASRELSWNLRGLSVTAPHKSRVLRELDWIDPPAREIGAVNTIVISGDQLLGYNTDAEGFLAPLREQVGELAGARCAVIGSGGAARAVLWALHKAGASIELLARDVRKGMDLANKFKAACRPRSQTALAGFDVVINATPMGMRGGHEHQTPATTEQLLGVRLAYDLVYNPRETPFLRAARAAGCQTLGGIEMFLAQAAGQFKLWTGADAPQSVMRAAVNSSK